MSKRSDLDIVLKAAILATFQLEANRKENFRDWLTKQRYF
jgi:hypothetical protein